MIAATAVAASERPILFSGEMVRAILAGRKCQTRRIVKPQPDHCHRDIISKPQPWSKDDWDRLLPQIGDREIACPYGKPGDRLWVREMCWTKDGFDYAMYVADGHTYVADWLKRSSIFMPRWASRITLEVTGVRVERVQDISEADAKAEGAPLYVMGHGPVSESEIASDPGYLMYGKYRDGFEDIWTKINGAGSWAANQFVWVIEFRRLA